MPFTFKTLDIRGLVLVKPRIFGDSRGFFMETYRYSDFARMGITESFVQDNHSRSSRNVLRGLHFQRNPNAQGKLVQCVTGNIFDVAVDIRKGSPSFGRWAGAELSGDDRKMLYVPPGFAHGFLVLSESADVIYKCTKEYAPHDDRGIIWNDPDIAVAWPVKNPIVSEKDGRLPLLKDVDNNFEYRQ
ncbi:MAG: dTDP-4-dehydrorhamnose 3,5-epimerase [Nitrospirota bacterium]